MWAKSPLYGKLFGCIRPLLNQAWTRNQNKSQEAYGPIHRLLPENLSAEHVGDWIRDRPQANHALHLMVSCDPAMAFPCECSKQLFGRTLLVDFTKLYYIVAVKTVHVHILLFKTSFPKLITFLEVRATAFAITQFGISMLFGISMVPIIIPSIWVLF